MAQHAQTGKLSGHTFQKFSPNQSGGNKPVSPFNQPRLSHNTAFTNSNKDLKRNQDIKSFKPPGSNGSFVPGSNNHMGSTSPRGDSTGPKSIPSFLETKNSHLKGSLFVDSQSDHKYKQSKVDSGTYYHNSMGDGHYKRAPRMSEHLPSDMKNSSTDFEYNSNKVPLFLQERQKDSVKKIPYPNDGDRPQSSKQFKNKNELVAEASLTNSYGVMKKSKIEHTTSSEQSYTDPTAEWVKKSWSKKKQKKYSINDFDQIKELGSGKYGHVFLAREKKTNFICALKIIEKKLLLEEEITQQFIRELKIQVYLNHPNIVRMYGFFDDAVNIYLILELAMGGQLFKQLKKLQSMPEQKVANIMRQVCQAVNELHANQIIHRDIKPENIVLHQNVIKLCDFGWSVYCDKNLRTTFCGTPLYVGPEILRGKEYDEKIDIWSLGVMMYEMLVGQNPFKITKQQQLIKIVKDQIKIPSYVELSEEAESFLFSCLQKNPENRLSIRELINHAFFKKYPEKSDKKMF